MFVILALHVFLVNKFDVVVIDLYVDFLNYKLKKYISHLSNQKIDISFGVLVKVIVQ
jgi:hypothetical protein